MSMKQDSDEDSESEDMEIEFSASDENTHVPTLREKVEKTLTDIELELFRRRLDEGYDIALSMRDITNMSPEDVSRECKFKDWWSLAVDERGYIGPRQSQTEIVPHLHSYYSVMFTNGKKRNCSTLAE
ncbi:hypothetical protein SNE40_012854 [Patella caerulea]|uniref:Uncharacterized protein n=1 Tax=Patella caerulea TaxID=87958 RepID=A0AAN8JL35_PATCE